MLCLSNLLFDRNCLRFQNVYESSKSLFQPKYQMLQRIMKSLSKDGFDYQAYNENEEISPKSLPKDRHGNVKLGDRRTTQVQTSLMYTDMVNLEFYNKNSVNLQGEVFNASGRRTANTACW